MSKEKAMPYIDAGACAGCSICVENCPMDALCIEAPKFHGDIHTIAQLNAAACIGCGICAKSCPIRAITMKVKGSKQ